MADIIQNIYDHQFQSIVNITATTTEAINYRQTMETSANILAQAPNLQWIQIGEMTTNIYYFDVQDTQGSVTVGPHAIYSVPTSKEQQSFCEVTIIPCGYEHLECKAGEWCN